MYFSLVTRSFIFRRRILASRRTHDTRRRGPPHHVKKTERTMSSSRDYAAADFPASREAQRVRQYSLMTQVSRYM